MSLKILIPMAGRGNRFVESGYATPKPLLLIKNKPLIQWVVDSFKAIDGQFIFCVLQEHIDKYDLYSLLNEIAPRCIIVSVPDITQGAVNTCLLAEQFIARDDTLIISNSDQIVEFNSYNIENSLIHDDGFILNFHSNEPKWSYVVIDHLDKILQVSEKDPIPISNIANVGVYGWTKAKYFFDSAKSIIQKNLKVNGEFYIAPTYNELIAQNFNIRSIMSTNMFPAGVPADFEKTKTILEA